MKRFCGDCISRKTAPFAVFGKVDDLDERYGKPDMKIPVIVIGSGGHARVLLDILQLLAVPVIGVTDIIPRQIPGAPYLGNDEAILDYRTDAIQLVNGLGSVNSTRKRRLVFERFSLAGFSFASLIHPSATISPGVRIAEGGQVMAGAVLQPGSNIGANTIVNTRASIDHDCDIGSHVHLAPGVTLSGGVRVGDETHIGTGAVVIQSVKIGSSCLIGAGSLVLKDIPPGSIAYGSPARVVGRQIL
ncbi:MAG: acetyltransferase [Chitinophagales bacterium]